MGVPRYKLDCNGGRKVGTRRFRFWSLACHALVVALFLMLLVAKVLDGLVVDEGVRLARPCLGVCLVHGMPELGAVLQPQNREQGVEGSLSKPLRPTS